MNRTPWSRVGIARGVLAALLAAAALVATNGPAWAASAALRSPAGSRAELDTRAGERATVSEATRAARGALRQRLGIESQVVTDPVGGGLRALGRTDGFLSGPQAGDPVDVALSFVRAHLTAFGLTDADLAGLRLVARYRSNDGVTHLTWLETSRGLPSYDSALSVHVTADGRVVTAIAHSS